MRKAILSTALACTLVHATDWHTASLPQAQETTLTSQHTGHTYRIQSTAIGNAPPDGYPVLYLLDGDNYFAHAALLAHTLLCKPAEKSCTPLLIVGIGYTGGKRLDLDKRARDYTPPLAETSDTHGGAAQFSRFLAEELPPLLASRHPVNRTQQTLYGHSYGGLYALYHLGTQHPPYRRYFISSPSIWWQERRILDFLPAHSDTQPTASIHISAGSLEKPQPQDPARKNRAMIENARHLAAQLNARFTLLEGESHGSAAFQAIHRMMQTLAEETATDKQ